MNGVYFGESVRLKSYSAVSKGGKSIIKIELETGDHFDLASILRQLDEGDREQREAAKPAEKTAQARSRKEQLQIAGPLLQLEDQRERET